MKAKLTRKAKMTNSGFLSPDNKAFLQKAVEKILTDTGWGCLAVTIKEGEIYTADVTIKMNPRKKVIFNQFAHQVSPTVNELEASIYDVVKATGWGSIVADFTNGEILLIHVHQVKRPRSTKVDNYGVLPFSE